MKSLLENSKKNIYNYLFNNFDYSKRYDLYNEQLKKIHKRIAYFYGQLTKYSDVAVSYIMPCDMFLYYYDSFDKISIKDFVKHVSKVNENELLKKELKNQIILDIKYFCELIKVKCFTEKTYNKIYVTMMDFINAKRHIDYISLIDLCVCYHLEIIGQKKSIFDMFDIPKIKVDGLEKAKEVIKYIFTNLNAKADLVNINSLYFSIGKSYFREINSKKKNKKSLQDIFEQKITKYLTDFFNSEVDFFLNRIYFK